MLSAIDISEPYYTIEDYTIEAEDRSDQGNIRCGEAGA